MFGTDFSRARRDMVERQLKRRGVRDAAVLAAMAEVPREAFVPPQHREHAYMDCALPIGAGQTISQPYVIAKMIEAAEISPGDCVLEIGAGSGYAAAVLSRIARKVVAVERLADLAIAADARLRALGFDNVEVQMADGTEGWPSGAPYDAIVVSAGGPAPPAPLKQQLAIGGRLVMPVGVASGLQRLIALRREAPETYTEATLCDVAFVPLVGAHGWREDDIPGRP